MGLSCRHARRATSERLIYVLTPNSLGVTPAYLRYALVNELDP